MSAPVRPSNLPDPSIEPSSGWHCTHMFYSLDRQVLSQLTKEQQRSGAEELEQILCPQADHATLRMQSFIVSGHKADFGMLMFDTDPLKIDAVHQRLLASTLGPALKAVYSFVSFTEISEYVPSPEQYAERLKLGGEDTESPAFAAKVAAYEKRLPMMNRQRLTPELPDWPSMCFYPMNKSRVVGANWFTTPYSARNSMMAEHAQSGMAFAGRATQVITVSVGVDDWEWGVTLWARNPDYLKDIVYKMRFDEASAKYGEFGQFFVGYVADGKRIAEHCCIGA
ncbi:hydrogen peroxide-dependent heme synthase [Aureliella helgolandensis]|uniref:Putative heme peroxidase n=1 Tax=Aureliella helgolandensis TaxID=2527968 RepID=A0A518G7A1_9BACT|nr:hydrogen peroxide-dependent heme synthase [Aureliella helgolandensis]QDV24459.1 putative heme peroxidase [Aureliella helgolandensis]